MRTLRMLKLACLAADGRQHVAAAITDQLAMAVQACANAGLLPADQARVEAVANA